MALPPCRLAFLPTARPTIIRMMLLEHAADMVCTQGNYTPVPVGIRAATATCHYGSVGPCHGTHQDWQPTGLCRKLQESSSVKIAVGYLESGQLAVLLAAAVLTEGDDTRATMDQ